MTAGILPPLATVRLTAERLTPAPITAIIGIQPDAAAAKGERFRPLGRWRAVAKTGTWYLTTRGRLTAADPSRHLSWVVARIGAKATMLHRDYPDLLIGFSIFTEAANFTMEQLPDALIKAVVALGSLWIDAPDAAIDMRIPARLGRG